MPWFVCNAEIETLQTCIDSSSFEPWRKLIHISAKEKEKSNKTEYEIS